MYTQSCEEDPWDAALSGAELEHTQRERPFRNGVSIAKLSLSGTYVAIIITCITKKMCLRKF